MSCPSASYIGSRSIIFRVLGYINCGAVKEISPFGCGDLSIRSKILFTTS